MASKELAVEKRTAVGTTSAHALRAAGKIPAVLYGHGTAPQHLAVDARAFDELLHHGGRHTIVTLKGGLQNETALVRMVQYHPVSQRAIHADLQRVSANETIASNLAVVTVGVARGIREGGGVMDVVTHELQIEGPANRIPQHLEVDVAELGVHDHITAGDVALPQGFTMLTPADTIVVSVEPSRTERELEEAAAGPAPVEEPEVIGAEPPPE